MRLLAHIARGCGFDQAFEEYEPPSVRLPRDLVEPPKEDDEQSTQVLRGVAREIEVRSFLTKVGDGE